MINVLLDHPGYRGIGIDEESAVVVKPNSTIEVIGNSNVMLFEPYKAIAGNGHAWKSKNCGVAGYPETGPKQNGKGKKQPFFLYLECC